MRLLRVNSLNEISLTADLSDNIPPYAILSHTWAIDNNDEVKFAEIETKEGQKKAGYEKIRFCAEQARKDGIEHFWVDTCCIDKANNTELSKAITSMFRWYKEAEKCYVYLSDVSSKKRNYEGETQQARDSSFCRSRWFTRGWTLQELLAPKIVEFFSRERELLGDKKTLARQIHDITKIPLTALHSTHLAHFSRAERMRWAEKRETREREDKAYCLLGIFDVSIPLIYGEGEKKAFRRLQQEIQEQAGTTPKSVHVHWIVPRTANPLFTGRQALLQDLEGTIHDAVYCPWDRVQCRIVIWGIGGQGKSEICLQLAHRVQHLFWAVLWIDISTKDIAERSFLAAAQRLSIPAQNWEDARHGIANLQYPWLLVLDNADDPEVDYQEYFMDSRYGVVVMTTRNDECRQYSTDQAIALQGLDTEDAQQLLLKAAQVHRDQHSKYAKDAQRVAALLESHPLALIQAGAYVSRGHCTLADYPRIYDRQQRRLLTFRPTQAQSRYRDVYTTFEVSAEMLSKMNTQAAQDALQLLPLLAVCGPSQFPLWLFENGWRGAQQVSPDLDDDAEDEDVELLTPWHIANLPSLCDTTDETWDPFRLTEAVAVLKAFSLVSTDLRNDLTYVSLHALVHAWARDRQNDLQQQHAWLQMGCLTALALSHEALAQDQKRWLQPHVDALVKWSIGGIFSAGSVTLVARILVRSGWYFKEQRADTTLFDLVRQTFVGLGLNRTKVERAWIGLYDLAARNLLDHGEVREAVALLEAVLNIREQTLGKDHLSRLASQHALARAYRANGQVKEAVVLLEEVVKIQEQILATDHPSRLASQHALATTYRANRQVKEAVVLLEEIVKIQEQILATDHPSRLASQHELAGAYLANGQVKEAVVLLEEVVKIQEQILAKDHLSRLASQHELAGAYQANRQVEEAVILLEEVVKIREQILTEDHPDRLASQHNLAVCLWESGERETSLSLMSRVVEIHRRVLDTGHPYRQQSEEWLAYFKDEMADLTVS